MPSDVKARIPLAEAQPIAERLVALLAPACERIEIAGSIRRRQPDIGDIEIVAVPKFAEPVQDIFGMPAGEMANVLDVFCTGFRRAMILMDRPDKNGRPAWGPKFKRMVYGGIGIDLFSVIAPAQWGVIFAIRTGPADYSHQFVTAQGVTFRDSAGCLRAGLMPTGLHVHGGALYEDGVTDRLDTQRVIPTPEEPDFFAAIGEPYREPWERR